MVAGIERALDVVARRAEEHRSTICIGRSHGIHAEPTTFGWKLAGWAFELDRARTRVANALEGVRVGQLSGTVGTYAAIEPDVERIACERLGLEPDPVSTQVVARDRHAGLLVVGLHASPLLGSRMGSVTYRLLCLTHALVLAMPPAAIAASAADVAANPRGI